MILINILAFTGIIIQCTSPRITMQATASIVGRLKNIRRQRTLVVDGSSCRAHVVNGNFRPSSVTFVRIERPTRIVPRNSSGNMSAMPAGSIKTIFIRYILNNFSVVGKRRWCSAFSHARPVRVNKHTVSVIYPRVPNTDNLACPVQAGSVVRVLP